MNQDEVNQKIIRRVDKAVNSVFHSPGNAITEFTMAEEGHIFINIWPAMREIQGGPDDGAKSAPPFAFDLTKFFRHFDNIPYVALTSDGTRNVVSLVGTVHGHEVRIILNPFTKDDKPDEVYHTYGPKAGQIEFIDKPVDDDNDEKYG